MRREQLAARAKAKLTGESLPALTNFFRFSRSGSYRVQYSSVTYYDRREDRDTAKYCCLVLKVDNEHILRRIYFRLFRTKQQAIKRAEVLYDHYRKKEEEKRKKGRKGRKGRKNAKANR